MQVHEFIPKSSPKKFLNSHHGKLIVIIFYAEWNKESIVFKNNLFLSIPIFWQFDDVVYISASAETFPQVFRQFKIQYVPTVIFTDSTRSIIKKFETMDTATILDSLGEEAQIYRNQFEKASRLWIKKIDNITSQSAVLIFIVGSEENQREIDHSGQLLKLFKEIKLNYVSYNILEDSNIHLWISFKSGYSSFPQIFIKGKFVGDGENFLKLSREQIILQLPKQSLPLPAQNIFSDLLLTHKKIILTNNFDHQNVQEKSLIEKNKLVQPFTIYNLSINKNLRQFVIGKYEKKLPLLFIEGVLQN